MNSVEVDGGHVKIRPTTGRAIRYTNYMFKYENLKTIKVVKYLICYTTLKMNYD